MIAENPVRKIEVIEQVIEEWRPSSSISLQNPIQVIDLFSGCGGVSVGFDAWSQYGAPYQVLGGIDIDDEASRTYQENLGKPCMVVDVRELDSSPKALEEFLDHIGYDPDLPLVLIGCAPCQGFSAHKKRNRESAEDVRNSLVLAFARIAARLRPDVLFMENVPELLSSRYRQLYSTFTRELTQAGYRLDEQVVNLAQFGVPQNRKRSIVIGTLGAAIPMVPLLVDARVRTVRDAIGDLPAVEPGEQAAHDPLQRSARHKSSTLDVIKQVPVNGGSRPAGVGPKCLDKVSGFYDVYGRLTWDKPSITITRYARNPASGRFVHPEQNRGLTIREGARLQSFPDSFLFEGTLDKSFMQIGEAVPPLFATAVAGAVLEYFQPIEVVVGTPGALKVAR